MRISVAAVVVLVVFGVMAYLGWSTLATRENNACAACDRPLHRESAVRAQVQGESRHFCCAACVIWAERQGGAEARITEVSDYLSGAALNPSEAVFVVGSNVNHCLRQHSIFEPQRAALDQARTASSLDFDRCSPSVLAFSSRSAAVQFAERQGGRLLSLAALRQAIP